MSGVDATTAVAVLDVLARYAQLVDARDWDRYEDVFTADAWFGADAGARERGAVGRDGLRAVIDAVHPYHPHHTTDTVLAPGADGTVRAWSKFLVVRTDGTAGSGDYLDVLVPTPAGWRIAVREVSRGDRGPGDPGGPSRRTFTTARFRGPSAATAARAEP